MRSKKKTGMTIFSLFFGPWFIYFLLSFFIGGYCVNYTVEFWSSYIKGVEIVIPFLPCAIAGLVISPVVIPLTVITWILSYII